jgi:hypothetical protein
VANGDQKGPSLTTRPREVVRTQRIDRPTGSQLDMEKLGRCRLHLG